jgi:predicted DNA-binding transcriptional regulator AlpA
MAISSVEQQPALDDKRAVVARTRLSKAQIHNLVRANKFPRPTRIGSRSYWDAREVSAWIESQLAAGRAPDNARFTALAQRSVAARKKAVNA